MSRNARARARERERERDRDRETFCVYSNDNSDLCVHIIGSVHSYGLTESLDTSTIDEYITKTYLYNFDPLKPHFFTVKLGFTGVYNMFRICAQKHRLWVLVRTASARRF